MSDDLLLREDDGAVTYLTMNSPGNLNALSDAMLADLASAFRSLQQSQTARVVVLRGTGKAFCAGHDLKEMTAKRQANDGGAAAMRDLFDRCFGDDADDPARAAAGDRRGAWHRHRRRLPARGVLRSPPWRPRARASASTA